MRFQGAVLETKEKDKTFAAVVVEKQVIAHPEKAAAAVEAFRSIFGDVPIVLVAQDAVGRPAYHGPQEYCDLLAEVPLSKIPWKEYAIT